MFSYLLIKMSSSILSCKCFETYILMKSLISDGIFSFWLRLDAAGHALVARYSFVKSMSAKWLTKFGVFTLSSMAYENKVYLQELFMNYIFF